MMRKYPQRFALSCVAALAAGTLLYFVRDGNAFSYYLVDGWPVVWESNQSVRLLSPSTFPADSEPDQLIRAAMGEWNAAPAIDFAFTYFRLDQDYPVDHFDGYSDTTAVPYWQLDPGVLGVTYLVNDGPYWFDMDIVFSDFPGGVGYNFDPFPTCDMLDQPAENGYSFLLIALHELGHGLGLGHEPMGTESPGFVWFPATMNPRYPSGGTLGQQNIVELHADDRNGIRFLYPHTGPAMPRTDLAAPMFTAGATIGKAVPAFFEPPVALPGDEVFLRSLIENLGTTSAVSVSQGFYLSSNDVIETRDTFLGALLWDLAAGQVLQFEVAAALPDDLAAGTYYLGSIVDDGDEIAELFEDNNATLYCDALTVERLAPEVLPLPQQLAVCGERYRGPKPVVTHPLNMAPITWTLLNPQPGMTIRSDTGEITWNSPAPSSFPYQIMFRATNSAGYDTQTLSIGVERLAPLIAPLSDATIACGSSYAGPTPVLTSPTCMQPILLWALTAGPPGMTVNPDTGAVVWPGPAPSLGQPVEIRAINSTGHGSISFSLTIPAGDMTGDAYVSSHDVAPTIECLSGPGTPTPTTCRCADADADGDADMEDIQLIQTHFD